MYEKGAGKMTENQKKGIVNVSMGKKKKFREAQISYKGAGAKAIYYRQLLEYRKTKYRDLPLRSLQSNWKISQKLVKS